MASAGIYIFWISLIFVKYLESIQLHYKYFHLPS